MSCLLCGVGPIAGLHRYLGHSHSIGTPRMDRDVEGPSHSGVLFRGRTKTTDMKDQKARLTSDELDTTSYSLYHFRLLAKVADTTLESTARELPLLCEPQSVGQQTPTTKIQLQATLSLLFVREVLTAKLGRKHQDRGRFDNCIRPSFKNDQSFDERNHASGCTISAEDASSNGLHFSSLAVVYIEPNK